MASEGALQVAVIPRPLALRGAHILNLIWRLKLACLGLLVVLAMTVLAVFAARLAPHNPYEQDIAARLAPPFWEPRGSLSHPLGTDRVGRDTVSRIIYGARVSLSVGALAVAMSCAIGVALGLLAGYVGRWTDNVISGAVDLMLAFPFILLALAIVAVLGPSFVNLVIALGVTRWPIYTRVVRAETLRLRELDFVVAARALGMTNLRMVLGHILPNLINAIVVLASLEIARMIILESSLSFLGLGVQPPTASWGSMLSEGRNYIFNLWWMATFPGLAIFVTTLGVNFVGDGLRDLLDPRLRNIQ